MIVLDASAAVDYLAINEPQASWVAACVQRGETLHAPSLLEAFPGGTSPVPGV